jgi:hypothetical protein
MTATTVSGTRLSVSLWSLQSDYLHIRRGGCENSNKKKKKEKKEKKDEPLCPTLALLTLRRRGGAVVADTEDDDEDHNPDTDAIAPPAPLDDNKSSGLL